MDPSTRPPWTAQDTAWWEFGRWAEANPAAAQEDQRKAEQYNMWLMAQTDADPDCNPKPIPRPRPEATEDERSPRAKQPRGPGLEVGFQQHGGGYAGAYAPPMQYGGGYDGMMPGYPHPSYQPQLPMWPAQYPGMGGQVSAAASRWRMPCSVVAATICLMSLPAFRLAAHHIA